MESFEELKSVLAENSSGEGDFIAPFPLLTKNAVESLRYRAEDVGRSVTRHDVNEARAQDVRNELLNSELLKSHFEAKPRELDLLKHDKFLGKKEPVPHLLCDVPGYCVDAPTQEASKIVKLNAAAMGNRKSQLPPRKRKFKKNRDPLKAISAEGPKQRSRMRRKGKKGD